MKTLLHENFLAYENLTVSRSTLKTAKLKYNTEIQNFTASAKAAKAVFTKEIKYFEYFYLKNCIS